LTADGPARLMASAVLRSPRGHRPYCGLNGRLSVRARRDRQRVASESRRAMTSAARESVRSKYLIHPASGFANRCCSGAARKAPVPSRFPQNASGERHFEQLRGVPSGRLAVCAVFTVLQNGHVISQNELCIIVATFRLRGGSLNLYFGAMDCHR
jgi:hypothetical protein